ncbi:hypothetical protein BSR29_03800 [Boudabousia liubingyangii]|uniref:YggT family protein n=1 Tax=Boudabousia liubingyangii TaxID=1921764 RepID=A0A1Q5PN42_9ACTO|nr:YggT family protein [Boudabousia liubingyangii]OKL47550.1 hypothetical protein BSR28_03370 [Boudabousia liubingyangii]OKL48974.1 hypothetical protein BSR29_03800 [Boudabousia liubingyangii]
MSTVLSVIYFLLWFYMLILLGRFVFDIIKIFVPRWAPPTVVAMIGNLCYALTDPPINFLRRLIPPLRLGMVALDMGILILFFAIGILQTIVVKMM